MTEIVLLLVWLSAALFVSVMGWAASWISVVVAVTAAVGIAAYMAYDARKGSERS